MYFLEQKGGLLQIKDVKNGVCEKFKVNKTKDKKYDIHGVYGIIEFNESEYLIIIKDAKTVGNIHGKAVYEVHSVKVIVIKGVKEYSVIKYIYNFFEIPGIFFSEFDLSKRYCDRKIHCDLSITQKDSESTQKDNESTFLFNKYPLSIYSKRHIHFSLKCIQGYFQQWENLCLISRRCPENAGARYFSRGCNTDGYCSNFVETEQIIERSSSYLHLRGSIPFLWKHNVGLKYAPGIVFPGESDGGKKNYLTEQKKIFEKTNHFLKKEYKRKITYLNLIKEKGYEKKLFDVYKKLLTNVKAVHYDFHNKINNIPIPASILEINAFSTEINIQQEIIRTNCIDCLDRTNSMQFIIGQKVLEKQLSCQNDMSVNMLEKQSSCQNDELLNLSKKALYRNVFKTMFFNNGNYLSIQYAGTPALLSTHILKNQSVIFGKAKDFYYSILRYWINRVQHGRLQTSYDIITGKFKTGKCLYHGKKLNDILILLWTFFLIYSFVQHKKFFGKLIYFFLFTIFVYYVFPSLINLPVKET